MYHRPFCPSLPPRKGFFLKFSHKFDRSIGQSVSRPVGQPVNWSVGKSVCRIIPKPNPSAYWVSEESRNAEKLERERKKRRLNPDKGIQTIVDVWGNSLPPPLFLKK